MAYTISAALEWIANRLIRRPVPADVGATFATTTQTFMDKDGTVLGTAAPLPPPGLYDPSPPLNYAGVNRASGGFEGVTAAHIRRYIATGVLVIEDAISLDVVNEALDAVDL